ncbi:MAG TPA: hypothetical protein VMA13_02085 [Candidatus Saccharimonadales bacterium]|nr:hypothetical protein [Candidatus Saccharimonadales bacterium]
MSSRSDRRRLTTLEEQAYAEAKEHFVEHLKQFPASRLIVERLEQGVAKIALAANMAASQTSQESPIPTDDGTQWHRSVDLTDNICLCHRPISGGVEYAVLEYFPDRGRHEIWHRGPNVVEVLRLFVQEQRQALQVWTEDLASQVREFLEEKYPRQNVSRAASSFMQLLRA